MKKTPIILIVTIFFLLIIGGFVFYLTLPSQEIIPSQCQTEKTGISFNSYKCQSTSSTCEISVTLNCNEKLSDERVIFRGSSQTALPSTIAVDSNGDGALEPFSRGSGFSSPCSSKNIITYLPEPYQSNYIYYNNGLKICSSSENRGYNYVSGGSISTSSMPLSGEECSGSSGFIRCSGNVDAYQCSENVLGSSSNIIKTVSYSGSNPGDKTEKIILNPNQEAFWDGQISWKEIQVKSSECTKNKADTSLPNVYYICSRDSYGCGTLGSVKNYCSPINYIYNEGTQQCEPPYTVEINLEKNIISTSEKFEIDFELKNTDDNANIPITTTIKKGSSVILTKTQLTGSNYITLGKTHFSLDAPNVGYYTITISFSNINGDFSKDYSVQVSEDLSVVITADNPIQFDSSPIIVYLKSFKSGSPKQLTNFELDAMYNEIQQYQYITENTNIGITKFLFNLNGDGTLRVRARGRDDTGLWTDWTEYFDITVKKSTVRILTDFPTDECVETKTLKFETKDSVGNYINTQNEIQIDKPLGGSDSISASGDNGKYSFTYNFASGGLYTIRITSTNSNIGTAQLNSGQGEIVNILSGDACSGGGGGEGIDWTVYIIIGVFIFAIALFVYFVFIRKNGK